LEEWTDRERIARRNDKLGRLVLGSLAEYLSEWEKVRKKPLSAGQARRIITRREWVVPFPGKIENVVIALSALWSDLVFRSESSALTAPKIDKPTIGFLTLIFRAALCGGCEYFFLKSQ